MAIDHPMRLTGSKHSRYEAGSGCNLCGGSDTFMYGTVETCDGRKRKGYVCEACLPKFHELSRDWEIDYVKQKPLLEKQLAEEKAAKAKEAQLQAERRAANAKLWAKQEEERKIREANIQAEQLSIAARAREQERLKAEYYASQASQNGIF